MNGYGIKETITKYYKYEYPDFVQPVLSSNGVVGGDSFAVKFSASRGSSYEAYLAFDGDESTSASTDTPQPHWLLMYNPNPLNVSSIYYDQGEQNYWATAIDIQASKTGEDDTWITLLSLEGLGKEIYTWDIDTQGEYYNYYRLYIKSATRTDTQYSARYAVIAELKLIATEQVIVEATQDDYDFSEEVDVYKIPHEGLNTKYYKYEYQDFIRPTLTEDGIMGGDSFAVSGANGNSAYNAWDGDSGTWVSITSNGVNETCFYNPNPIKITTLGFTYYPTTWISSGEIYGSNDHSDYVLLATFSHNSNSGTIDVNSNNFYKYHKIKVLSANGYDGYGNYVIADIYEVEIDATEQITVEGTQDDYNYAETTASKYYGMIF